MSFRRVALRLIGVWLMVDGAVTGMWFSGLADSLGGRDLVSVGAMVARMLVAALSVVAGWLIAQRRPPGVPLGIAALGLIGLFGFLSLTGVLPSNLDPTLRRLMALVQAACASAAILVLRREAREDR